MLIKGGTIINENERRKADVRIREGRIWELGEDLSPQEGETILPAFSKWILPGGVDVHTHLDMPAAECSTCDDFFTGTRAAVCGGTTTVIDFAEYDQGLRMQDGLDTWHKKAAGRAFCDYGFHMTVSEWRQDTKEQLASMRRQGITSFKAYTAYKDALGVDDRQLFQIMEAVRDTQGLLCVHCENGDILEYMQEKLKAVNPADIKNHPASRPNLVEKEAVSRVLDLAAMAEAPVYIVHVSTKEALEAIRSAKQRGQIVFAETCPQYLLLDDSKYGLPGFEAAKYVISPPLRKKADQEALWEGLRDKTLDAVSTDHCSFYFKTQKRLGLEDFTRIPNGAPGVEHRMELMLHHGMTQAQLAEKIKTTSPYVNRIIKKQDGVVNKTFFVELAGCLPEKELGMQDFKITSDGHMEIYDLQKSVKEISAVFIQNGIGINGIGRRQGSLEDYFFEITGSKEAGKS